MANPPMVVFTTAYSEHAVISFELDAVDYLLKPFSLPRFLKACNKAAELYELRSRQQANQSSSIFIKDGYEQIRVELNDILYIEAAGNYTKVHLANGSLLSTRVTVSDMLTILPSADFIRTHRAFIVARAKVARFDRETIYIENHSIPVGATYAQCLRELSA